jgi:2-dehydro-3-deoxygluconokinase
VDLVTFGEAMLRLSMTADSFKPYVGGSELNVAVLAARLGVQTRWVSRLPDNALGKMIAARAAEQGVDTQVEWTPEGRVGLYFLESGAAVHISNVLYDRAGSAFSQISPGAIDWSRMFSDARWYHVSGITPALSESALTVTAESLAAAKNAGMTVSYDVNYRPRLWTPTEARAVQEPLLELVDVLVITEEDARVVFGAQSVEALTERFGIGAVAMTLRDNPCAVIAAVDGKRYTAPRHAVETVDRIGAGDAFTGGLIVSRLQNRGWDDALRIATATAALKHTIPGDFCLISRADVDRLLR